MLEGARRSLPPNPLDSPLITNITLPQIDGAHRNLSPHFSVCLSRETAENFKRRLVSTMNLSLSRETSQVQITLLDRRRAVYTSATSDLRVRGGELKDNEEETASGTLLLKKVCCFLLPSGFRRSKY